MRNVSPVSILKPRIIFKALTHSFIEANVAQFPLKFSMVWIFFHQRKPDDK